MSIRLLALLGAVSLGACDLLPQDDNMTVVSGVVVNRSTGEPLAGINVSLVGSSGILSIVRDAARTNGSGQFQVAYAPGPYVSILDVHVNRDPYDPRYQNPWFSVRTGRETERSIDIYEYTRLTVIAEPDPPMGPGEQYEIHVPCTGGQSPVTTTCGRGNAMTQVMVFVHRAGVTETVVDSVYTPLGVETTFRMRF